MRNNRFTQAVRFWGSPGALLVSALSCGETSQTPAGDTDHKSEAVPPVAPSGDQNGAGSAGNGGGNGTGSGGTLGGGPAPGDPGDTTTPLDGVARVWALHDGDKIKQDDIHSPLANANDAWSNGRVHLFGARNEVLAFQIIVEAGAAGISKLSVSLDGLRQRGGNAAITYTAPDADPTVYAGHPIALFSEHYMNVTDPTQASWIFRAGTKAAPKDADGLVPVQLVPENAKAGMGGFPLDVKPSYNQAFWVDVYTGRGLPAGVYDGNVKVHVGDKVRSVPIELEIMDFDLPDENSLTAMLYYEDEQPVLYQGDSYEDRYRRFAHRQRVELVHKETQSSVNAAKGRFDGSMFTASGGYEGPGEHVGDTIVPASFYSPGNAYDDRASAWKTADAWMTFLKSAVPGAKTFLYMPDEPSSSDYPRISTIAENVKSNPGAGAALPIFATSAFKDGLDGSIDIWCANARAFDFARAKTERAKGRSYWFYNGGRPATGAVVIDAPAADARVQAWAAFKAGVDVYFYWHADQWQHNGQKEGDRNQNVWANPITFDIRNGNSGGSFANGDGVLMYPGTEKLHPNEDRGVKGPISSFQLANLRRGIQDHLYLTMAQKRGQNAVVDAALASVVPKVFSEAGDTVAFAESGSAYEQARRKLGAAIAAAHAP